MRKMKKTMAFTLILSLLAVILLSSAVAAEIVDSGKCGKNVKWSLDGDGVLTVSGKGDMTDCPWIANHIAKIYKVVIESGVTSLCDKAFYGCEALTTVTMADTVTAMGIECFANCTRLSDVTLSAGLTAVSDLTFCGCKSLRTVKIPANVTEIGYCAFYSCSALNDIAGRGPHRRLRLRQR